VGLAEVIEFLDFYQTFVFGSADVFQIPPLRQYFFVSGNFLERLRIYTSTKVAPSELNQVQTLVFATTPTRMEPLLCGYRIKSAVVRLSNNPLAL
jgi:hypothetical protein